MLAKRDNKYNDNPGPGQYEAQEFKAKGIKMGEKLKDRAPEDLPGPGNYDQKGLRVMVQSTPCLKRETTSTMTILALNMEASQEKRKPLQW
ncbi:MAG: hypothetical protein IPK55_11420 [Streptococcus sp.]|nr:hypothetical protein [Streptococcus sp.]